MQMIPIIMIFVCVIRLLLGETSDFDERQLAAQGKAARAAIWACLIYSIPIIMFGNYLEILSDLNVSYVLMVGCCIVMMTYLTVAIVLDAYIPLNFPGIRWLYLCFGTVGIAVFLISCFFDWIISTIASRSMLALGIVFLWAGALMFTMDIIHKFSAPKDGE